MPKERRRTDDMILEKMIENGETLAALGQEMKDLKVSFKGFAEHILGGDGKIGLIPEVKADQDKLTDNHEKLEIRVRKVEKKWAFVAGGIALLFAVTELAYRTSVFWKH